MSVLALIGAVLGLVPRAVEVVRALASSAHRPEKPLRRKHAWDPYEPGASLRLRPVPVCTYCGAAQTAQNIDALCPAVSG